MLKKWFYLLAMLAILSLSAGAVFAQNDSKDDPEPTTEAATETDSITEDGTADDTQGMQLTMLYDGETLTDFFVDNVSARLYAFNASAGDVISLAMTQQSEELDPYMVLLGPAGEVLASDDDSGDVGFSALIDGLELPMSGSYFVLATTWETHNGYEATDIEGKAEVTYDIVINGITEPTELEGYDPDRYDFFAGTIATDETLTGVSSATEPVFYFIYSGTAGDIIDVTLFSEEFDTVLHMFNDNGERLAVNDDANGTNSAIEGLVLPETGSYMIFATDYWFTEAAESDNSFLGGTFALAVTSSK